MSGRGVGVLSMLGVTPDEMALYVELLEDSPRSDAELRSLWVGTTPLDSVVSRLVAAGLVARIGESSEMYQANEPATILGAQLQDGVRDVQQHALALQELEKRSREERGNDTPAAMAELVTGEFAVRQVIDRAQRSIKSSLRCVGRLPHQRLEAMHSVHRGLLERGVECRVIYDLSELRSDDSSLHAIERLNASGQRSRILPATPLGIYLVDDRYAIVTDSALVAEPDTVRILRSGALMEAFGELFECLWHRAVPQEVLRVQGEVGEPDRAEDEDRRIVGLLLTGLTDAAIARQLGLSPRTVQRRVASMLKKFGVHTRFQLGVQVALHEDQLNALPKTYR